MGEFIYGSPLSSTPLSVAEVVVGSASSDTAASVGSTSIGEPSAASSGLSVVTMTSQGRRDLGREPSGQLLATDGSKER